MLNVITGTRYDSVHEACGLTRLKSALRIYSLGTECKLHVLIYQTGKCQRAQIGGRETEIYT